MGRLARQRHGRFRSAGARRSMSRPGGQGARRRVRYLLPLKGRPPFGLAGIEMFTRLQELVVCLQELIEYQPEPRPA